MDWGFAGGVGGGRAADCDREARAFETVKTKSPDDAAYHLEHSWVAEEFS